MQDDVQFINKKDEHMQSLKAIVTGMLILAGVLVSAQESYASITRERPDSFSNTSSVSQRDYNRQVTFPGGARALHDFLATHFELPENAVENGLEGTVIITCVIDVQGRPTEIKVKQSVHRIVDEAALAAVRQMPRWLPAHVQGTAVPRSVEIPFAIVLR